MLKQNKETGLNLLPCLALISFAGGIVGFGWSPFFWVLLTGVVWASLECLLKCLEENITK